MRTNKPAVTTLMTITTTAPDSCNLLLFLLPAQISGYVTAVFNIIIPVYTYPIIDYSIAEYINKISPFTYKDCNNTLKLPRKSSYNGK